MSFCVCRKDHRRKRVSQKCGLRRTSRKTTGLRWTWSQM